MIQKKMIIVKGNKIRGFIGDDREALKRRFSLACSKVTGRKYDWKQLERLGYRIVECKVEFD